MVKARLGWALALVALSGQAQGIRAIGLFPERALLEIDGTNRLLRVGEATPEGIRLLASDSRRAEIEIDGRRVTLELSQHIAARFTPAEYAEVRIPRDGQGHYFVGGHINGHSVQFMVDTGATLIALNSHEASRLGLSWENQPRRTTSTAGGVVPAHELMLTKVSVGGITLHEIPAIVVIGRHPSHLLLGNSFLTRVEMNEDAGTLILRQRH